MWSLKQPKLIPFGHKKFELELPTTLWLPTTLTLHPYKGGHGIVYLVK